jgi:hypothetical protein
MEIETLNSAQFLAMLNAEGVDIFRKQQTKFYKIGEEYFVYGTKNGTSRMSALFKETDEEKRNARLEEDAKVMEHYFGANVPEENQTLFNSRFDIFPGQVK